MGKTYGVGMEKGVGRISAVVGRADPIRSHPWDSANPIPNAPQIHPRTMMLTRRTTGNLDPWRGSGAGAPVDQATDVGPLGGFA